MALSISHIQTFSLHDGPGIRTTVFLSGCPLRCLWCHNPETQSSKPQLLFDYRKCIYCGACSVCPNGVHRFEDGHILLRNSCDGCGLCVRNCPTEALSFSVRILSTEKFIKLAKEQDAIFGADGGITFSGGEPLLQWQELLRLSELVQTHLALETCGYADTEVFGKVVAKMDYIMLDLKLADPSLHRKYTGVDNEKILENLNLLRKSGKPFLLRTPLIPGITDTPENLETIRNIVGEDSWEQLPYNTLTPVKYERLGKPYQL